MLWLQFVLKYMCYLASICRTLMALWYLVLPQLCTHLLWKGFAVWTKVCFSSHINDLKFVLVCLCEIHWYFMD